MAVRDFDGDQMELLMGSLNQTRNDEKLVKNKKVFPRPKVKDSTKNIEKPLKSKPKDRDSANISECLSNPGKGK